MIKQNETDKPKRPVSLVLYAAKSPEPAVHRGMSVPSTLRRTAVPFRVRSTQPPGACSREKKGRENGESTFRSDSPVPLPFCPPSAEVGAFGAPSPAGCGREKDVLLIALSSAGKIKHRVRQARGRANVFEAKLTTIKKLAFLRSERVSLSEPRRSLPKLAQILTENARARA